MKTSIYAYITDQTNTSNQMLVLKVTVWDTILFLSQLH